MAEKESGRYMYESYQPLSSKQQKNGTNSMKRCEPPSTLKTGPAAATTSSITIENPKRCCNCIGTKATSFWVSLVTNLGICALLVGYTTLGSFVFLAIEGGAMTMHQRTLASTNRERVTSTLHKNDNVTLNEFVVSDVAEARQKTVENIWDITVSLNILYRENWTR